MLMKILCNLDQIAFTFMLAVGGGGGGGEWDLRGIIIFLSEKIQNLNLLKKTQYWGNQIENVLLYVFAAYKSLYRFSLWQDGFSQNSRGIIDFIGKYLLIAMVLAM